MNISDLIAKLGEYEKLGITKANFSVTVGGDGSAGYEQGLEIYDCMDDLSFCTGSDSELIIHLS